MRQLDSSIIPLTPRTKNRLVDQGLLRPAPTVFSRAQIQSIVMNPVQLKLYQEAILQGLDPQLLYDNVAEEEHRDIPKKNRLEYYYDRIRSPLLRIDPWRWKMLVRIKKFMETGNIYQIRIKKPLGGRISYTDIKHAGQMMNRYIFVKGVVKKVTNTVSAVIGTSYSCKHCKAVTHCSYHWYERLRSINCDRCGSKRVIELPQDRSLESWQNILVYPLNTGEYVHSLRLRLLDPDDFDGFVPGEQVSCHGILKGIYKDNAVTQLYLDVEEVTPLDARRKKITVKDAAAHHAFKEGLGLNYWDALKKYLFPGIHSLNRAKDATMLQLFGGATQVARSNIHVLMVGNPSTGKSALMRALQSVTGGAFVSGMGATNAGLTATVYKDEVGAWCLDGGALVMSQPKTVYFDQMDKVPRTGQDALLEAMEQQTVSVSKAGINMTLPARCRILAACNPKVGCKFDTDTPYVEQLGLTAPLLSRFDLIIVLDDDTAAEAQIVRQLLQDRSEPDLGSESLPGFIQYAQGLNPTLSPELRHQIAEFYLRTKNLYADLPDLPFSIRQLEGMIRLATAKAKSRLSLVVQHQDWIFVKDLAQAGYYKLTQRTPVLGAQLPPGLIESGISKGDERVLKRILQSLESVGRMSADRLYLRVLEHDATITRSVYQRCLHTLEHIGKVHRPDRLHVAIIKQKVP